MTYRVLRDLFSVFVSCVLLAACATAPDAARIERPDFHVGDRWVYRTTTERPASGVTVRVDEDIVTAVQGDSITLRRTTVGSGDPPVDVTYGTDWSRRRVIDGASVVVGMDSDFPLFAGKTWDNAFRDVKPGDPATRLRRNYRYVARGWEDVTADAVRYRAMRIEIDGEWHVESRSTDSLPPDTPGPDAATYHFVSWYAPAAMRVVRVEEQVTRKSGAPILHSVIELVSFAPQR